MAPNHFHELALSVLRLSDGETMPDAAGRLSPEDNAKIQNWWALHWKAPVVCPVCKTSEWLLADHVVNLLRHAGDAQFGLSYPHIIVGCKSCSHAMFFNAVAIGVAPAWSSPPQPGLGVALTAPSAAVSDLFGGLAGLGALSKKDK